MSRPNFILDVMIKLIHANADTLFCTADDFAKNDSKRVCIKNRVPKEFRKLFP